MNRAVPLAVILALGAAPAQADTLREALARAYQDNPTITAGRAQQRALDENVPIARAAGRPTIGTQAGVNENYLRSGNSFTTPERAAQAQLSLNVPFFSGGAVRNSVRAAETRVQAGQFGLRGTEASLFTEVVGAYNDVLRDEAIVSLNAQNVRVLETNLQASRDRFEVGDLTRTDVAQSEARLSLARAQLQRVQANLIGSRENYVRLVGNSPGALDAPPPLPNLPQSADGAVEVALRDNPTLLAALKQRDATAFDIRVARASRLPTLGIGATGSYVNYLGSLGSGTGLGVGQSGTSAGVGLNVSLPLFQGGRPAALVRQAQAQRAQAIEQATAAERQVIASARSAYAVWQSSLQVISSSEQAVAANQLSLEGVRAENSVGNRTILDILNAEQELLNSQVTLVTARRDAYVAGFALLAAMGQAEAEDLGLEGGPLYNSAENFRAVRGRFSDFGDGPAPVAVAPSTSTIPAQNAAVARPLDPALDSSKVDRSPGLTTGENAPNR
ncbi:TolC family outer membrane protein [Sphingomonas jeddahensis]|uniref:Outer membrane efflux protein BepC n=1 Tax=Sphingomonas jeddahensis TaxID=1915074 RepID=A0A1V2ETF7_9SPHN|nr:TolC family outer membrane protein [Sphingomonas jeddahensis]ONF95765.1 Outer membrane efflux protein BepC precursor [Sphingomonas jeddahensis]